MEYCAVQAPPEEKRVAIQGYHVEKIPNGPIIAVFGSADPGLPKCEAIVKFQVDRLFSYVKKGWKNDLKSVIKSAFRQTDADIKREFDVVHSTQSSSMLAIVDPISRHVCTAGAGPASVQILGKSCRTVIDRGETRVVEESWRASDRHVAIVSHGLSIFLVGSLEIILESWIRSVGLVEACKAIVGKYKDSRKTMIIITLKKNAHLPFSMLPPKTKLPPLNHGPWQRRLEIDQQDKKSPYADPRAYVRPLKDGESTQEPEPIATRRYEARQVVEPGDMTMSISPGLDADRAGSSEQAEQSRKRKRRV